MTQIHRKCSPLRTLVALLCLSSRAVADDDDPTSSPSQVSTAFTDAATGIKMERFFGARTTFGFGLALPATPGNSFIGQLSFPLADGAGWGALGLTGEMENNFFLATWPDGRGGVMASFRQGTDEDDPPEVRGGFAVRTIPDATSVNATFLTHTFLCEGCLDAALGLGPESAGGNAVMGWALSARAVRNPASAGARLGFHERGFGPFTMRLAQARFAEFDGWAALANASIPGSARAIPVSLNVAQNGDGDDGDDSGDDSDDDDDD
ncbi:hypothetical protein GGS23DRAFT_594232 [Durotheca rogersii]|uniref:uncharacterized protein n=1 Tax=Durotheca rogersii TaxID=419775 RepID=UPI002220D968|nr:uncharacterized protein GGS23DRAFT_594232 [Durotheca rogersii]KAI5866080.1 hypothetical protein GGS23DRAFT_594232 [Durotheca rogersii]